MVVDASYYCKLGDYVSQELVRNGWDKVLRE